MFKTEWQKRHQNAVIEKKSWLPNTVNVLNAIELVNFMLCGFHLN